jgi:hypothetical protein
LERDEGYPSIETLKDLAKLIWNACLLKTLNV